MKYWVTLFSPYTGETHTIDTDDYKTVELLINVFEENKQWQVGVLKHTTRTEVIKKAE